jgi:hypothetical protein
MLLGSLIQTARRSALKRDLATVVRKSYTLAALAALFLFAGSVARLSAGTTLFGETFESSVAPAWTFVGNASLTGGSVDPNGQGWLRLTPNNYNQSSFVFENTDLPFLYGIDIKLQFAVWGGTGADGFSVNLINGAQNLIQPGGYGGSLGYGQRTNPNPASGLPGGILGIGVDEFGNYSNPTEGRVGGPGFKPNTIAIRGPGDGTLNAQTTSSQPNYGYLTGGSVSGGLQTGANGTTTRPTNTYQAEFLIGTQMLSQGQLPISVLLTDNTGTHTIINNYDAYSALVAYYGGAANLPQTMDLGFSAGTGAQTDYHEIRALQISSINDIPGFTPVPEPPAFSLLLLALGLILFGSAWGRRAWGRVLRQTTIR